MVHVHGDVLKIWELHIMPIGPILCHMEGQPSHKSSCHHVARSLSFSGEVLLYKQLLATLPLLLQGNLVQDWGCPLQLLLGQLPHFSMEICSLIANVKPDPALLYARCCSTVMNC